MGYVPAHWEDYGRLPPKGGLQVDRAAAKEEEVWYVGLPPTDGGDGGGGTTGDGYLQHTLPEYGCRIHCNQAHYELVSGGRAMNGG